MRSGSDTPGGYSTGLAEELAREIRIDRYANGGLHLDFGRVFQERLGLSLRAGGSKRRILASLKGLADRAWIDDGLVLAVSNMTCNEHHLVEASADALMLPATRPLTPRQVLKVLPIKPQERLRWTKDGRMPQSGSVQIRRAHIISVPTYAIDTIAALVANPAILDQWRADDVAASQHDHRRVQATG